MIFKTESLKQAFDAQDARAFARAALEVSPPAVTQVGARADEIRVQDGLQIQVSLLSSFEEHLGGDSIRDGAHGCRMTSAAKTMAWPWRTLVRTVPTAQEVVDSVMLCCTPDDGVCRTPDGYVFILRGERFLPVDLADIDGLQYKEGGRLLPWLESLDYEELPE